MASNKRPTNEIIAVYEDLARQGLRAKQIARKMNISTWGAHKFLNKYTDGLRALRSEGMK